MTARRDRPARQIAAFIFAAGAVLIVARTIGQWGAAAGAVLGSLMVVRRVTDRLGLAELPNSRSGRWTIAAAAVRADAFAFIMIGAGAAAAFQLTFTGVTAAADIAGQLHSIAQVQVAVAAAMLPLAVVFALSFRFVGNACTKAKREDRTDGVDVVLWRGAAWLLAWSGLAGALADAVPDALRPPTRSISVVAEGLPLVPLGLLLARKLNRRLGRLR